jgi:hypothetical protein
MQSRVRVIEKDWIATGLKFRMLQGKRGKCERV